MIQVPFLDLRSINLRFQTEFARVQQEVLESGWVILGEQLKAFETAFAAFTGVRHCIGVANGLDALILTLRAFKELSLVREGDEVLVPANTYIATILAVFEAGLKPVLVDTEPGSYVMTVAGLQSALTSKTRAILPVHLYGELCPMPEIMRFAGQHELLVLEDCAQSHGAHLQGIHGGAFGHAGAYSFYPGKNLGALGDGGAIITQDDALAEVLRAIRNYGSEKKYHNRYKGLNSRLDELQAAFLAIKLKCLVNDNRARRQVAQTYLKGLQGLDLILPDFQDADAHVWHLFVIRHKDRDNFVRRLLDRGIQTMVHYPVPPHQQVGYAELHGLVLPNSESLHREVLSLPMGPTMTDEQVQAVIEAVRLG